MSSQRQALDAHEARLASELAEHLAAAKALRSEMSFGDDRSGKSSSSEVGFVVVPQDQTTSALRFTRDEGVQVSLERPSSIIDGSGEYKMQDIGMFSVSSGDAYTSLPRTRTLSTVLKTWSTGSVRPPPPSRDVFRM